MERTFKDILSILLTDKGLNKHQSYLLLKNNGVRMSQSMWYLYVDGYSIPSISKIKDIFDAFNFSYDDNFITRMYEYSILNKEEVSLQRTDRIKTGISLRVRNLSKYLTDESQIRFALNERIRKTGCENLSEYIQTLICEDIDNEILKTGGNKND